MSEFENVYNDAQRASAYATLQFPGTYYLAFRDIPAILKEHATGTRALDFGCGAGRSTRFLQSCGYQAVGVDISESMISLAREADPGGIYNVVEDGALGDLGEAKFDVVLSAFPFDNIPGDAHRVALFRAIRDALNVNGRFVLLGSTPEIYTHEWASFSTNIFPANFAARTGDQVCTLMKDVADARPVVDILWTHEDYVSQFERSGLTLRATYHPLGREDEPYPWISETRVAPWVIYVLGRADIAG